MSFKSNTGAKIFEIYHFLNMGIRYDYTGLQFFEIKKGRPLCRLMDVAKSIIRESLPIKCLEAVILAMYPFVSQRTTTFKFNDPVQSDRCCKKLQVHSLTRYISYLTSDLPSVQRFPLAFKTTFENNTFK